MKRFFVFMLYCLLSATLFAKAYKVEVFNSENKDNLVEIETEEEMTIALENGEGFVEDTDIVKSRGKGYLVLYLDNGKKILIRNATKRVKDLVEQAK